jgi:starch synthase
MTVRELAGEPLLRILFVSAEVAPYAKVGGLADVAGSLPNALRTLGHDVRIIMPRYGCVDPAHYGLGPALDGFSVSLPDRDEPAGLLVTKLNRGVPVYFVESERYLTREAVYDYPDDGERFLFFCLAALEAVKQLGWQPDIVHCNDWHTAIIPNLLRTTHGNDPFFAGIATVYSIHNLAYQGIFDQKLLEMAGLGASFLRPEVGEQPGLVNLVSRGILYADAISTVSPTYAQEILTPEYGAGLDGVLKERKARLFGILNGLNTDVFDPATDPHLVACYDLDNLERKVEDKLALQREGGLTEDPSIPLVSLVSRLADQKGFDLLLPIVEPLLNEVGAQFVLLGTGERRYHDFFRCVGERYPGQAAIALAFDGGLAQRIYAGADMFLMPSRYEPCGLGQMIAMRYGTIPVVRRTGGLADTVADYRPSTGEGNGFVFENYTPDACFVALLRAVEAFRRPAEWRLLQRQGMEADFSWGASARQYVELYRQAQALRATG